jgi:hypothetical protein
MKGMIFIIMICVDNLLIFVTETEMEEMKALLIVRFKMIMIGIVVMLSHTWECKLPKLLLS